MVKSKAKSIEMRIIQVYMPTREHDDEEVEDMHEKIDQLLDDETKGKDYTVVIFPEISMMLWEKVKRMDMSAIMVWDIVMIIVDRC